MVATDEFFDEQTEASQVKTRIVASFFSSWSNVMVHTATKSGRKPRLSYIDLFAGPGTYGDGAKSTPVLVMEKAIATPALREGLVSMFNDADASHSVSLRASIEALPGYAKLKHKPAFLCDVVGGEFEQMFADRQLIPSLSFIDPFGYKGVTAKLIRSLAKDWGSDCIFFFNYRRINPAITNDRFRNHMDALFGRERVEEMRRRVVVMKKWQRVEYVLETMASSLRERGFDYFIPFLFREGRSERVTHAIVYVTKHPLGFRIMKDIMAAASTSSDHGVPSYAYCPSDATRSLTLDLTNAIEELADQLALDYAGRKLSVGSLIRTEEPKSRYLVRNFRDAIGQLERSGRVAAAPPASTRQKKRGGGITCGDTVILTFPGGS